MSNGNMLKDIKNLIASGDDFTVKQYRILSLSGMVELGDNINDLRDDIKKVDEKASVRVCPEVLQAQKDIVKLEGKSNRNDGLVTIAGIAGAITAAIFGGK